MRLLSTLMLTLLAGACAHAADYVMSVRGAEAFVTDYCQSPNCHIIPSDAKEFSNGNTFVRIMYPMALKPVHIMLPALLSPNALMETLLKARTASNNFAQEVIIVLPPGVHSLRDFRLTDSQGLVPLDLTQLFFAAGVSSIQTFQKKTVWYQQKARKGHPMSRHVDLSTMTRHVVSHTGEDLAQELASQAQLPYATNSKHLRNSLIFYFAAISERVNETFFRTLARVRDLTAKGNVVFLFTLYLPYARSDKANDQPEGVYIATGGKLIADLIEATGISAISFVRAHAPQSEGFFSIPTLHLNARSTIEDYLRTKDIDVIVSPDAGFQKDATLYADELGKAVAVVNKQRDPFDYKTKIVGISGDVHGKKVVIIDDETASGGTLKSTAEYVKSLGAKSVIAVVTHLAGDPRGALDSPALDEIVVTNTLPVQVAHPKLKVLDLTAELTHSLYARQILIKASCIDLLKSEGQ